MSERPSRAGRIRVAPELLLDWFDLPPGHELWYAKAVQRPDGSVDAVEFTVIGPSMPVQPEDLGQMPHTVTPIYRRKNHELVEIRSEDQPA